MILPRFTAVAAALLSACVLTIASCSSEKKADAPKAAADPSASADVSRTVSVTPGQAGGVIEDTLTAMATVAAIDASTRKVTLKTADGAQATFTAPPEVRNFDQIRVGDKVNATVSRQFSIAVGSDGALPSAAHAAMLATAPKGAKPGAMVAESYELVATIQSIDSASHRAKLLFADGQTRTVPVRQDVELSKYHAGDNVVIKVTESLMVLVETP